MKAIALAAFALAALPAVAAPVVAPTIVITPTSTAAPTPAQATDCIAVHWIGARSAQNPASPTAAAERNATVAWVTWLAAATGQSQTQLQPGVKAATDRLADPALPDAKAPILTRCAAFERVTAPAGITNAATGQIDEQSDQGEEGDAPLDGDTVPADDGTAAPTDDSSDGGAPT